MIVLGFRPYRQYSSHVTAATIRLMIGYKILKFPWRISRAYSSSKSRETVICVPRGCYSWHEHHLTPHPTDMNPSSLYTIMCTQLLEHDKVIQNDQRAQPILVYLFLSYHCITFIFFFSIKEWSPRFISTYFISKHSVLIVHSYENIDRKICNAQSQLQNNVVYICIWY